MKATPVSKEAVVDAVRTAKKECKDPHAQAYLAALPVAADEYGAEGVVVQLLYALTNMGTWRGDNARSSKATLKAFCKAQGAM